MQWLEQSHRHRSSCYRLLLATIRITATTTATAVTPITPCPPNVCVDSGEHGSASLDGPLELHLLEFAPQKTRQQRHHLQKKEEESKGGGRGGGKGGDMR